MKKTLLSTIISISLVSLSACQTAKVQTAQNTSSDTGHRKIAQAAAEGALELIFNDLASKSTAQDFDAQVLKIINTNRDTLGIANDAQIKNFADLDANVAKPKAFINALKNSQLLSGLVSSDELMTVARNEINNANVSANMGNHISVPDLVKTGGPVSEDSFKEALAAGASKEDVDGIIAHARNIKAKNNGNDVILGGCSNLENPEAIHNLNLVAAETDANVPANANQAQIDTALKASVQDVTHADADGAKARVCALAADPCKVLKVGPETCAE